ncbi:MAG: hypothetical protein AAFV77_05985 [Planctomycetota bacterium]
MLIATADGEGSGQYTIVERRDHDNDSFLFFVQGRDAQGREATTSFWYAIFDHPYVPEPEQQTAPSSRTKDLPDSKFGRPNPASS